MFRSYKMGEFRAVVGLNRFERVFKEVNGALYKVNCREAAVLLIGVDETLSRALLKHRVFVEVLAVIACIADLGTNFTSICHFMQIMVEV